ncbi:hypothetical protein [Peijinzhouia sedimentorum]
MISSIQEYESITTDLIKTGYHKVEAPWTFYSEKYGVVLDVLPFGEIEEKNTENFTKRNTDLHLLGFQEVLSESTPFPIEEKIVNIPPLPGMILLKLIAWSDRPEERENDLEDILKIIQHYFDLEFDEIVEFYNDIFPEDTFDQKIIAAEVLGRKAKHFLEKSKKLSERIQNVIKINLKEGTKSTIVRDWAKKLNSDIEYAQKLLLAFQKGLSYQKD